MDNERSLAKEITEGFEALKSMRNNEPVAWMELYKGKPNQLYWEWDDCKNKSYWTSVPLYTHPVKEQLTDEEIIAVGNAVVNHIDSNEGWIEFARAILRKAQEK